MTKEQDQDGPGEHDRNDTADYAEASVPDPDVAAGGHNLELNLRDAIGVGGAEDGHSMDKED